MSPSSRGPTPRELSRSASTQLKLLELSSVLDEPLIRLCLPLARFQLRVYVRDDSVCFDLVGRPELAETGILLLGEPAAELPDGEFWGLSCRPKARR